MMTLVIIILYVVPVFYFLYLNISPRGIGFFRVRATVLVRLYEIVTRAFSTFAVPIPLCVVVFVHQHFTVNNQAYVQIIAIWHNPIFNLVPVPKLGLWELVAMSNCYMQVLAFVVMVTLCYLPSAV